MECALVTLPHIWEFAADAGAVGGSGFDFYDGVIDGGGDDLGEGFGVEIWESCKSRNA